MAQNDATLQIGAQLDPQLQSQLQRGLDTVQNKLKFTFPLGNISSSVSQFNRSMDAANQRVITFGASLAVLATTAKIFRDIVSSTTQVEKSLADINSVFQLTTKNFDVFSKKLFDVARETSQSFETTAEAAKEFSRQGLSMEQTLKSTRDALILTRLASLDTAEAVSTLTASVNGFQKAGLTTTEIINKLATVDSAFAVSSKDLAQGLARAGASASDAGIKFDELIALITSAQQSTARGGAVIGNALKTIFTRVQRADTIEAFESLGVAVKNANGEILPTIQILENFAKTYDKLNGSIKNQAAEMVGGVYQINVLKATLNDLAKANGTYQKALDTSNSATDNAIKRNEALNQTFASLSQNFQTTSKQIFSNIGNVGFSGPAKSILGGLNNNFIADALKDASGQAESIGGQIAENVIKGFGGAIIYGLAPLVLKALSSITVRTLGNVAKDFGQSTGISKESEKQAQIQAQIESIYNSQNTDLKLQLSLMTSMTQKAELLQKVLLQSRASAESFSLETATLASMVSRSGKYNPSGKAGGYIPTAAGGFISEYNSIAAGVGGAPANAKPVLIPNFAFGSGKYGPIVANSSEFIVPNFSSSGGSAIYNRNMVASMGLPPGAKPIAAGGYIPNAAGGYESGSLRNSSGTFAGVKELNQLFENIAKAATVSEASKFGPQIIDLAASLNKISEKRVLKDLADEFDRITKLEFSKRVFYGGKNIFGENATPPNEPIPFNDPLTGSRASKSASSSSGFTFADYRSITRAETTLRKSLNGLSNSQLELIANVPNGSGGNGNIMSGDRGIRKDTIQGLRGELNQNGLDSGRIATLISLGQSGTLRTNFENTVKGLIENGTNLEKAFTKASQDFRDSGGTNKQLKRAQEDYINSFISYKKTLEENQLKQKQETAEISKSIQNRAILNSAYGNIGSGKTFSSLSKDEKRAIFENLQNQAINKLGYGDYEKSEIFSNPTARKQVNAIVNPQIRALRNSEIAAAQRQKEIEIQQKSERSAQFKSNALLASSFILPAIGSSINEGEGGTTSGMIRGGLSSGLSLAGTGIGIGSIFGPVGALTGAAIGAALGGLYGAISKSQKSFEELAKEVDQRDKTFNTKVNSANEVFNIQDQIQDALDSGDGKLAKKLRLQRSDALSKLDYQDRNNILSYLETEGGREKYFKNLNEQNISTRTADNFRLGLKGSMGGVFSGWLTSTGLGRGDVLSALLSPKQEDIRSGVSELKMGLGKFDPKILAKTKITEDNYKSIFASIAKKQGLNQSQITENLKNIDPSVMISMLQDALYSVLNIVKDEDVKLKAIERARSFSVKDMIMKSAAFARFAKSEQIKFSANSQVIQSQQQIDLQSPGLSELDVNNKNYSFQQGNLYRQKNAEMQSELLSGKSEIFKVAQKMVMTPELTKQLQSIGGVGDINSLISKLSSPTSVDKYKLESTDGKVLIQYLTSLKDKLEEFGEELDMGSKALREINEQTLKEIANKKTLVYAQQKTAADAKKALEDYQIGSTQNLPQETLDDLRSRAAQAQLSHSLSINNISKRDYSIQSRLNSLRDNNNALGYQNSLYLSPEYREGLVVQSIIGQKLSSKESYNKISTDYEASKAFGDIRETNRLGREKFKLSIEDDVKNNRISQESGDIRIGTQEQRDSLEDQITLSERLLKIAIAIGDEEDSINEKRKNAYNLELQKSYKNGDISEGNLRLLRAQNSFNITRDSKFTSGSDVSSSEMTLAKEYGIQGDAQKSFTTGFHSVFDGMKKDMNDLSTLGKNIGDSLSNNLGNAFGDFVTGAKSAKDAFKSFAVSVLNDVSRMLASQAVMTVLGSVFGFSPIQTSGGIGRNTGGPIGFAKGGQVPALLTGGEYYFSPQAARRIGYETLNQVNKYADGGMVRGGSGVRDDVPARLPVGSYIIRKSAVQRLGSDYLNSMAENRVQHRFIGGMLVGALLGGGIGYVTGGKKGAIAGAVAGGILGGLTQNYSQTGNIFKSGSNIAATAPVATASNPFDANASFQPAGGGAATTIAQTSKWAQLSALQKAGIFAGASAVLGVGASMLSNKKDNFSAMNSSEITANRQALEAAQLSQSGQGFQFLQPNPQGGYSSVGYIGDVPATRRWGSGGPVGMPENVSRFADGGPVGGMISDSAPMKSSQTTSPSSNVTVKIEINNNGGVTSSTNTDSKNQNGFGPEFAEKLQKQVRGMIREELVVQSRSDGFFTQKNRYIQ